jgi:NAD+ synthase (glutamine-hydrolysing)
MARNRLSHNLRVALAQINMTVGDLDGNSAKIIANIASARESGADVVVFPELAVTGYPPEDLLLKRGFVEANAAALERISRETKGITAIVGFVDTDSDIFNAAAVLHDGEIAGIEHKFFLPNYGVFDEDRYFQVGTSTRVYKLGHIVFGVEVCEDVWYAEGPHATQSLVGGAHIVFDINSSPFHAGKWRFRERMLGTRAADNSCAMVYLNAVGGQDELVFDGNSLVVGPTGEVLFRCKSFEEQLAIVDIDLSPVEHARLVDPRRRKAKIATLSSEAYRRAGKAQAPVVELRPIQRQKTPTALTSETPTALSSEAYRRAEPPGEVEEVYKALVLGTRDYVNKNGFKEVVLGLSGGIDSALTACIACDALGPDRVRALVMPSEFSSVETQSDAEKMAANLGIRCDRVPISEVFEEYKRTLAGLFTGTQPGIAEENIQARIRGNLLMAVSNKFGSLVLTTGNKSELACGYATLYGDMAGGFAVIKDCPKTLIYKLSRYRNTISPDIPESIIDRPPSAELKPDQKDSDTLPPYEILDPILEAYVEEDRGIGEIVAMGFDEPTVRRVVRMVDRNEYKRRQAAPGIKITPKAFGRDRRLPITNGYRE